MPVAVQAGDDAGDVVSADTRALIRRAVEATLRAQGVPGAEVSVTLLGDTAIAEMNERWRHHDGPTDVLAFPLYEADEPALGDVYIGVEQATRQAAALAVAPAEELVRLAIHGTLHVLGHDHTEHEDRTRSAMWQIQERLVAEVMQA